MIAYPIKERIHAINGVPGRMYPIQAPQEVRGRMVHRGQMWVSEGRKIAGYGAGGEMFVNIRFDDQCANGHQSFAITADVYTVASRRQEDIAAGGCLHDEIEKVFPELAPLIKWHLMNTDGPMHYVANTMYHASDKANGYSKGEPCAWEQRIRFADSPVAHPITDKLASFIKGRIASLGDFQVIAIAAENKPGGYQFKPKFTFVGYGTRWHECAFDDEHTAQEWAQALNTRHITFERVPTQYSEGKARNLDAARSCGVWPDATDEELCAEPDVLKAALLARLPALIAAFRADMDAIGMLWEPEQTA